MKNTWSKEEILILDGIEAKLINSGVPRHQARLRAEQKLEQRHELAYRRKSLSK
jgi:hypothetical protein